MKCQSTRRYNAKINLKLVVTKLIFFSASGGWPERSNPYANRINQLLDYYKAIAQQEKQEKLERERKKFAIRGKYITLTVRFI